MAKDLYPGNFHPTVSHVFISLLAKKGLLHQLFTQNIDCLERTAGIPGDLIVEAHGSFATQRCIECKTPYPDDKMRDHVSRAEVPQCIRGEVCNGYVKPDIVFFGEALPSLFYDRMGKADDCDLALVMGTSLQVHPFASLPTHVGQGVPRVLFNLEQVGGLGTRADDVLALEDCDTGVRRLADELGWREELESEWRRLVGEDEAKRQLEGNMKRAATLKDEVSHLVEKVDDALHGENSSFTSTPLYNQSYNQSRGEHEERYAEQYDSRSGLETERPGELKHEDLSEELAKLSIDLDGVEIAAAQTTFRAEGDVDHVKSVVADVDRQFETVPRGSESGLLDKSSDGDSLKVGTRTPEVTQQSNPPRGAGDRISGGQ